MTEQDVLAALDFLKGRAPLFEESSISRYRRGYDLIDWSRRRTMNATPPIGSHKRYCYADSAHSGPCHPDRTDQSQKPA